MRYIYNITFVFTDTALSASGSFSQDAAHTLNREGNGLWSPHRTFQQVDDALCLPLLSLPGELPLLFRPPQVFRPLEVCIVATKDVGYSRMYIPRTQFKYKPNT